MSFGEKILNYKNDIIDDIKTLVSIPSCATEPKNNMPFGEQPAKALNWVLRRAEEMGLKTKNVDNYVGHVELGEGNDLAAVLTHVDVVPAGEGWSTDPFTLTEKDGKLFGRGVADDKSSAIVSLYCLKVLKDQNIIGKKRIRAIFGSGEECGMDDMSKYFEKEQMPSLAFTPDSEYGICNREKGILQIEVSALTNNGTVLTELHAGNVINAVPEKAYALLDCSENEDHQLQRLAEAKDGKYEFFYTIDGLMVKSYGIAAHASQPEKGLNAGTHLIRLLSANFGHRVLGNLCGFIDATIGLEINGESMGIEVSDEASGKLTLNLGTVDIDSGYAKSKIDIRYPVTADGDKIIKTLIEHANKDGLSLKILNHQKPLFIKEDTPLVTILKSSYKEIIGVEPELYSTGGGTYARSLSGNGLAFGPIFAGEDSRLHNADENIDIEKLMKHAQICLEAMYKMFTID